MPEQEGNYWTRSLGRRRLLRGGAIGGAGLAAAALIGCGGEEEAPPSVGTPATGAPTAAAPAATGTSADPAVSATRKYPFTLPEVGTPKKGGKLTNATNSDIGSFDTTKSGAIGNYQHTGTVYDTLLRWRMTRDEAELPSRELDNDIENNLAESRELGPDGLKLIVQLRPGIVWQNVAPLNGRAFTSEDVAYAYNRYAAEGVHRGNFEFLESIETPDALTVVFNLMRPSPDFIVPLAEQNLAIFPREIVENGSIDRVAIGTGPFIQTEAIQSDHASYIRNPDYWGHEPYLDEYEIRIMPDAAARLAGFRAGQLGTGGATNEAALQDVLKTNPDIQVTQGRRVKSIFAAVFNQQDPKWQDKRVRQALMLAIDRDEINELLYDGLSETLPVIPWHHVYDHVPTYEAGELGPWWRYDPDEAQSLLRAAGAEGLTFNYLYWSGYLGDQTDVWVDQLRRIGVTMNLQSVDYTEFNSQLASVTYPDATLGWDLHGTQADNYFRTQLLSTSAGNWHNINDPELDQWAEDQSVELDPQARREILLKMWHRVLEDAHRVEHPNSAAFGMRHAWLQGVQWTVGNDGLAGSTFGYNNSQFIPYIWLDK